MDYLSERAQRIAEIPAHKFHEFVDPTNIVPPDFGLDECTDLAESDMRMVNGHVAGRFAFYTKPRGTGFVIKARHIQVAAWRTAAGHGVPTSVHLRNTKRRLQYISIVSEFVPENYRITRARTVWTHALQWVWRLAGIERFFDENLRDRRVDYPPQSTAYNFRCKDGFYQVSWGTVWEAYNADGAVDHEYIFAVPWLLGAFFETAAVEGFTDLPTRCLAGRILRKCWIEGSRLWHGAWQGSRGSLQLH